MKHIGQVLNQIIEEQKIPKKVVAKRIGITPGYLSGILHKNTIDCQLLERICKVLNISPCIMFDDGICNTYNVSGVRAETTIGDANVNISQGEVENLHKLLAEKERTIQVLLRAKGFDTPDVL